MTSDSGKHQSFVCTQLNGPRVPFLTIQCKISLNVDGPISPTDRTLQKATTPVQSGLGRNGIEGVLYISRSSRTGASPLYAV